MLKKEIVSAAPATKSRERVAWVAALGVVVLFAAVAIVLGLRPTPISLPEMRLDVDTLANSDPVSFALIARRTATGVCSVWGERLSTMAAHTRC